MKFAHTTHSLPRKHEALCTAVCKISMVALFTMIVLVNLQTVAAQADLKHELPSGTQNTIIPAGERRTAPDFSLVDAQGKMITLSAYRGKVVLLDFWATWCGGCKIEIPWYMEFDGKYKDAGLAVIGISRDADGWKAVRPFLARKRDPETSGNTAMKYPVVIGSDHLAEQYHVTSLPVTLLIDRDGRIAVSHTGMVDKDTFEKHIQELLK